MEPYVSQDRLREILNDKTVSEEVHDLAHDALMGAHIIHGNKVVIKELRDTIKRMEEKRPYVLNRPRIPIDQREALKASWEAATPGPWGVWAQQPDVILCANGDPAKPIAFVDTYTGRGCFDAEAMGRARGLVLPLLEELESLEEQEKMRWRILSKTSPSGKTLYVCLSCGRESTSPTRTCPAPIQINSGGSVDAEVLDCELAYARRAR